MSVENVQPRLPSETEGVEKKTPSSTDLQFELLKAAVPTLEDDPYILVRAARQTAILKDMEDYGLFDTAIITSLIVDPEIKRGAVSKMVRTHTGEKVVTATLIQRIRRLVSVYPIIFGEENFKAIVKELASKHGQSEETIYERLGLLRFSKEEIDLLQNMNRCANALEHVVAKISEQKITENERAKHEITLTVLKIVSGFLIPVLRGELRLSEQMRAQMPFRSIVPVRNRLIDACASLNDTNREDFVEKFIAKNLIKKEELPVDDLLIKKLLIKGLLEAVLDGVLTHWFYNNAFPLAAGASGRTPHRLFHHFITEILYRPLPKPECENASGLTDEVRQYYEKMRGYAELYKDPAKRESRLKEINEEATYASTVLSQLRLVARVATAMSLPNENTSNAATVITPEEISTNGMADLQNIDKKTADFISAYYSETGHLPPGFMLLLNPYTQDPESYDKFVEHIVNHTVELNYYKDHEDPAGTIRGWASQMIKGKIGETFIVSDVHVMSARSNYRKLVRILALYGHMSASGDIDLKRLADGRSLYGHMYNNVININVFIHIILPAMRYGYPGLDEIASMIAKSMNTEGR